nr:toxin [Streptomyces sp. NBC_00995]
MRVMMRLRSEMRRLLRQSERRLAGLPGNVSSIPELVAAVEESQGRSIQLIRVEDTQALHDACGMRATRGKTTHIFYRSRPTPHQTEHVLLHELAHEWLGHDLAGASVPVELTASVQQRVGAGVPARQVVHEEFRYDRVTEREAAMCAYLLAARMGAPATGTNLISRLEATLSRPLGRRHAYRGM